MARRSFIRGTGGYLPERVLTNEELSKMVDTSDEWIRERTGIKRRHVAAEGELTSDIATAAARSALESAGILASEVDLIVLATTTPDQTFPATATAVQAKLGMTGGAAFDVQAVCSGFLFALATADSMLKQGLFNTAVVIGAETFTRILDWSDRGTCVLFGDGAGAIVLEAQPAEAEGRGVLSTHLRSDGRHRQKLFVDGGPSSTGTVGHLRMIGKDVFRHAVGQVADVMLDSFAESGVDANTLDWFVPHQANARIIDASAEKLGIAPEKVIKTVALHGNTSAASIPLALDVAVRDGRLKPGHLVMIEAVGGGFTWGAAVIRW